MFAILFGLFLAGICVLFALFLLFASLFVYSAVISVRSNVNND